MRDQVNLALQSQVLPVQLLTTTMTDLEGGSLSYHRERSGSDGLLHTGVTGRIIKGHQVKRSFINFVEMTWTQLGSEQAAKFGVSFMQRLLESGYFS